MNEKALIFSELDDIIEYENERIIVIPNITHTNNIYGDAMNNGINNF